MRFFYFLLFCFSLIICISCGNDDKNESDINTPESEYYVKYHYSCDSGNRYYIKFEAQYLNEIGVIMSRQYGLGATVWGGGSTHYEDEIICGPFKYGDTLKLWIVNAEHVSKCLLEISVSKDNAPFALKETSNGKALSYTINY